MKIFIPVLFSILFAAANAQDIDLQGKFSAGFLGAETIEFYDVDSFRFNGFYCTHGVHGKGRCEVKNNYLYLYFEKLKKPVPLVKSEAINKIFPVAGNDAAINVFVSGADNEPLNSATILLESPGKEKVYVASDSNGHASFKLEHDIGKVLIRSSYVGLEIVETSIDLQPGSIYNIYFSHKPDANWDKELNRGEVFIYEIEDLSTDFILMRPHRSREKLRKYTKAKD